MPQQPPEHPPQQSKQMPIQHRRQQQGQHRRPAKANPRQQGQHRSVLSRRQRGPVPRYAQPSMVDRILDLLASCQEMIQNIQLVRQDSTYSSQWFDGAIWLLEAVGLLQKPPMHPPENEMIIHPKRGLVRANSSTNIWKENFKLVEGRTGRSTAANLPSYQFEKSVYD